MQPHRFVGRLFGQLRTGASSRTECFEPIKVGISQIGEQTGGWCRQGESHDGKEEDIKNKMSIGHGAQLGVHTLMSIGEIQGRR